MNFDILINAEEMAFKPKTQRPWSDCLGELTTVPVEDLEAMGKSSACYGKGGGSAPAAPDPSKQAAANIEAAIAQGYLNAQDVNSPFGNVNYEQTGTAMVGENEVPRFTQNVNLSPEQQQQFDLSQALKSRALGMGQNVLGNVESAIQSPFNLEGLPGPTLNVDGGPISRSVGPNDFSADRQRVEQSIIDRAQPQFDRRRDQERTQLINQGFDPESEAYEARFDDVNRAENDFLLGAIQAGGQEQSRLFGLDLAKNQFGNQAQSQAFGQGLTNANLENTGRQNLISERAYERSQPINEYATLLGLGGNVQTPQWQPFPGGGIAPADTTMGYQGDLMAWQQANQNRQSTMGNIFGLGGTALAAFALSDRRLKTDIKRVGETDGGLQVYTYRLLGGPVQMGVMAQDLERIDPDAVIEVGGVKMVNYARVH